MRRLCTIEVFRSLALIAIATGSTGAGAQLCSTPQGFGTPCASGIGFRADSYVAGQSPYDRFSGPLGADDAPDDSRYTAWRVRHGAAYGLRAREDRPRLGWYVRTWGDDNRFDAQRNALLLPDSRSRLGLVSVETGYGLRLAPGSNWVVEPQVQMLRSDNFWYGATSPDGLSMNGRNPAWTWRLGASVYTTWQGDRGWRLRPYAALNWWHEDSSDAFAAGAQAMRLYPEDRYEAKAGLQMDFGPRWSGWGSLGWQQGNQSYKAWSGQLGLKFAF